MAVFEKVVDAEGKETFVEVEIAKLDFREHPDRQKLLDEAVKYRKQLQAAKKAATEGDETPSGTVVPPADAEPQKPAPVIPTVDDVLLALEKRQAEKALQVQAEETAWNTKVDAAVAKHKLPAAMRAVVANSRDPEAQAAALAKSGLTFADSPAGSDEPHTDVDQLFANIDKRMGLGND